ncbi:outer membrane beta-barrel protein [Acidithiobacillus sp. AMEEHan]|uniref:outer membrane beta-barrel protein n=1 Tax=Acidithiobacillus sp. AMEEHan TaxID=2994951 RepID=UPI0027E5776C|nr:outer membrane beta-barrel protein [Acidithiobacillus sp. AMEEHan]
MTHHRKIAVLVTCLFSGSAGAAVLPATPPTINVDAGPLGKLSVGGLLSVNGRAQSNRFDQSGPAGKYFSADVTDGLVSVAKTSGLLQFYVEAGAYNFYGIGQPASSTGSTISSTFGPLPLAYLQITPSNDFNIQIGKLPAITGITPLTDLISSSYNIQFGLDGWQQQTISRGIQANYSAGPFSASVAWTDGYYSKRFNWVVGQLSYNLNSANSITIQGGGNAGQTDYAGPLDNSDFYLLGYNYSGSKLNMFAYLQYQKLINGPQFGNPTGDGDQYGASIDANYAFTPQYSLSTRLDYMAYSDTPSVYYNGQSTTLAGNDLGYGPGSRAVGLTLTPIYQTKHWFLEGELSYVHVYHFTPGDAFGQNGNQPNQFVGLLDTLSG